MGRHTARNATPAARVAVAAIALLALAACSGSNGQSTAAAPTSASASGGDASGVAAQASAAASSLGTAGGSLDVSKLCAAVPSADVQKLFKATAPAVTVNPLECDWGSGAITVDIYAGDTDKQYYNSGGGNTGTSIGGIGDIAQWMQPVPGATVPDLAAHKGSLTITVTTGIDVADTTMQYTGKSPFYKIPAAAAQQYAAEEGQICNDMFQAAG